MQIKIKSKKMKRFFVGWTKGIKHKAGYEIILFNFLSKHDLQSNIEI